MPTTRRDVLWITRGGQDRAPLPIQAKLLEQHYSGARVVPTTAWGADQIVDAVQKSRCVDWVLLAPELVMSAVLVEVERRGVSFPLRPAMGVSPDGHGDVWLSGRHHAFYGFQRVRHCEFIQRSPTPQPDINRVLPILEHDIDSRELWALKQIFPRAQLLDSMLGRRGSGEECLHLVLTSGAQGCLLVGPPKFFERVAGGGVYTVRADMAGDRFVGLQHVVGFWRDMRLEIPYTRAMHR